MPEYRELDAVLAAVPAKYADVIRALPAARVRPVVMCKDCQFWQDKWDPEHGKPGEHYCAVVDSIVPPDWFCGDGEAKEMPAE